MGQEIRKNIDDGGVWKRKYHSGGRWGEFRETITKDFATST